MLAFDVVYYICYKYRTVMMSALQVAQCYAEEMRSFPGELQSLLKQHASVLHPDVRMVSGARAGSQPALALIVACT